MAESLFPRIAEQEAERNLQLKMVDVSYTITRPMTANRGFEASGGLTRMRLADMGQWINVACQHGDIITVVAVRHL